MNTTTTNTNTLQGTLRSVISGAYRPFLRHAAAFARRGEMLQIEYWHGDGPIFKRPFYISAVADSRRVATVGIPSGARFDHYQIILANALIVSYHLSFNSRKAVKQLIKAKHLGLILDLLHAARNGVVRETHPYTAGVWGGSWRPEVYAAISEAARLKTGSASFWYAKTPVNPEPLAIAILGEDVSLSERRPALYD